MSKNVIYVALYILYTLCGWLLGWFGPRIPLYAKHLDRFLANNCYPTIAIIFLVLLFFFQLVSFIATKLPNEINIAQYSCTWHSRPNSFSQLCLLHVLLVFSSNFLTALGNPILIRCRTAQSITIQNNVYNTYRSEI